MFDGREGIIAFIGPTSLKGQRLRTTCEGQTMAHALQTQPTDRAVARHGLLMGLAREFRLLPGTAFAHSQGHFFHGTFF